MRNPWLDLPASAPYVLPCDKEIVTSFNRNAPDATRVRPEHLPEPYMGRPDAPVVLLNQNPGYSALDDRWHTDPSFIARVLANLRHEAVACPFYLFDPEFDSPGRGWWTRHGRWLLECAPLADVGQNLFCVELYGYHSIESGMDRIRLPSQAYSTHLVRTAMERGAVIVRMRAEEQWFGRIPELASYRNLVRLKNHQRPWLSPGNMRGQFGRVEAALRAGRSMGA